jgi:hypothetical protein
MIRKKKSSIKLAAALFLLSVTASGYSVLHKFDDGSAYDASTLLYHSKKTVEDEESNSEKVRFYVEIKTEDGQEKNQRLIPLLYERKDSKSGAVARFFFNSSNNTKLFEGCIETEAALFQESPLTFKRCIAESDPFFSQWKWKIEHTLQHFKSEGIFTVYRTLTGEQTPQQISFRVFEAVEGPPEKCSKPKGDACPASNQLGKLEEGVGSYERKSYYTGALRGHF